MRINEKKYIILGSLCALLLTLAVGYAAFQTNLKIKGTSNISSKWDILITNVQEINKGGSAVTTEKEGEVNPNWDGLTANIEADLAQKGDFIEYEVTIENRGTLDAKLNEIKTNVTKEHEAILISFSGYTKGEKLEKGKSHTIIVRIEYNPEFEGIPEIGSKEINIELEYNQNDDYTKDENGEVISPDRYLVTYNCITNGGTKCTDFNEYLKEGESIDLTNQGPNKKYDFIGWNTDPKAKEGLTELQMGTEEKTLYAIYQGDPIIRSWTYTDTSDFHSASYKQSIISAEFLDNKNIPETATESWDVSSAQDGSVMAWVIPDTIDSTKHHLYIGGRSGVIANENSGYLFYQFANITSIDFHKNFDTSNVTTMEYMFSVCKNLIKLNVSNFDTRKVTSMRDMFTYSALVELDLSNFNTSKVTDMQGLFYEAHELVKVNVNNFDTSNVTKMYGIFYNNNKLTKLNLCSWDTRKVTDISEIFYGTTNLTKAYVGLNWVTTNANTNNMFGGSKISSVTKSDNCAIEAEDPATINVSTTSTTKSITVVVDAKAESGIAKYEYQIDDGQWIESTENIHTFTDLESNTGYSIKVRVTSKVGKQTIAEVKNNSLEGIETETTFEPKSTEQTFIVPQTGIYKLEVWGAQGGSYSSTVRGGYGGYATGTINFKKNQKLYINVGEQGVMSYKVADKLHNTGMGGGSTQFTLSSGALSTFVNKKEEVLIVAGGGGGSYYHDNGYFGNGGSGGGINGAQGEANKTKGAYGGTQTSGGVGYKNGSFGLPGRNENVSGGYGWYGGGTVTGTVGDYGLAGSGGGSGYIGNSLLTNKVMYCYNCTTSSAESTKTISTTNVSSNPISNYAKLGSGYAKITLLEIIGPTTLKIDTPTFEEVENDENKEVTITYPEGCGDTLTCSYQKDEGDWVETTDTNTKITFTESGNVVAKVTDGTNEVSASHTVIYEGNQLDYNEEVRTFTADKDGYYKVELWGAQGGSTSSAVSGGKGAYTSGEIYLEAGTELYVYIGQWMDSNTDASFNGGAQGDSSTDSGGNSGLRAGSGGGATDIRLVNGDWNDATSLNSRIMVAAGGGGASNYGVRGNGGVGGALIGESGVRTPWKSTITTANIPPKGGNQSFGGAGGIGAVTESSGGFGYAISAGYGGGSGSGYYAGGTVSAQNSVIASGAGGSSYISGYAGVNSITSESDRTHTNQTKHYSDKYFINTEMKAGVNSGNGKAKITYLKTPSSKDSIKIKGVRYIKDCINGNSVNTGNHWTELQAINKGINVAKGKTVTGTSSEHTDYPYSIIVDGIMDNIPNYAYTVSTGMQCITVDLGREYDLEEIAIWHYYGDGRTYYNNSTSVAGENEVYRVIYNGNIVETSNGHRIKSE